MQYNIHRPFHIYDGHTYFITARTYNQVPYFSTHERKQIFIDTLRNAIERFDIKLYGWSLLHNHYHMMFGFGGMTDFVPQSVTPHTDSDNALIERSDELRNEIRYDQHLRKYQLVEFIRKLHKDTSRKLNHLDTTSGRKVWYQYWDYCIRNKADFWRHFNYIVQQPLKHGIVRSLREAFEYDYSSNPIWKERFGAEGLWESFVKYPVTDWTPSDGVL